jgi:Na+/melibiose symporter-like transporter
MGLEQIIPAIFLIAVLVLVLPSFLRSNSKSKQFFKNLFIWSVIVVSIMIITYLIS